MTLANKDWQNDVAMFTSRDVGAVESAQVVIDGVTVQVEATVGLSNAEAVDKRLDRAAHDAVHAGACVWMDTIRRDA